MKYGSGFMNLSSLLGVNKDSGEGMGSALANDVDEQGQNVKASMIRYQGMGVPGADDLISRADNVEHRAGLLGSQGGRQAMLQDKYGKAGNYNAAQSGFDALLSGQSPKVQQVSQAYQNLASQMGAQQSQLQQQFQKQQAGWQAGHDKSVAEDEARRHGTDAGRTETQEQKEARWWTGVTKPGEYAEYSDFIKRRGQTANDSYKQGRMNGAY